MKVRCKVCGRTRPVQKWQADYDKVRQLGDEPYICEACQVKIQHDAQTDAQ